jgi:hypothetical protein
MSETCDVKTAVGKDECPLADSQTFSAQSRSVFDKGSWAHHISQAESLVTVRSQIFTYFWANARLEQLFHNERLYHRTVAFDSLWSSRMNRHFAAVWTCRHLVASRPAIVRSVMGGSRFAIQTSTSRRLCVIATGHEAVHLKHETFQCSMQEGVESKTIDHEWNIERHKATFSVESELIVRDGFNFSPWCTQKVPDSLFRCELVNRFAKITSTQLFPPIPFENLTLNALPSCLEGRSIRRVSCTARALNLDNLLE